MHTYYFNYLCTCLDKKLYAWKYAQWNKTYKSTHALTPKYCTYTCIHPPLSMLKFQWTSFGFRLETGSLLTRNLKMKLNDTHTYKHKHTCIFCPFGVFSSLSWQHELLIGLKFTSSSIIHCFFVGVCASLEILYKTIYILEMSHISVNSHIVIVTATVVINYLPYFFLPDLNHRTVQVLSSGWFSQPHSFIHSAIFFPVTTVICHLILYRPLIEYPTF